MKHILNFLKIKHMNYEVDKELRILKSLKYKKMTRRKRAITNFLLNLSVFFSRPVKGMKLKVYKIKGYQNQKIKVFYLKHKKQNTPKKALIYLHGGSFQLEGTPFHIRNLSKISLQSGHNAIYVKYRLAPKYPFPYGLEDSYQAYLWVKEHADMLDINIKHISIGGDSAGGNLAIGVACLVRDRLKESFNKVLLFYPVIDHRQVTESIKLYTDTPVFNSRLNEDMWESYLKNGDFGMLEYASFMDSNLRDFPETYIETAEYDCLRDEGIMFAEKLKDLNTKVYERHTMHSVHGYDGVFYSQFMKQRIKDRSAFLLGVLKK
ncbi:MAG: alpha/beta hydrolase [Acholeplasmataceae bacterium]|nr:alpha/beta hydrolase [Acholeplasmataceae bacterium]